MKGWWDNFIYNFCSFVSFTQFLIWRKLFLPDCFEQSQSCGALGFEAERGLAAERRVVKWTVKNKQKDFSRPAASSCKLKHQLPGPQLSKWKCVNMNYFHEENVILILYRTSYVVRVFLFCVIYNVLFLFAFKMKELLWEQQETSALCFLEEPQTASLWKRWVEEV